jgi:hypothetical protein
MAEAVSGERRRPPFRGRFIAAFVVLSFVLAASVGGIVALVVTGPPKPDTGWSSWQPSPKADRAQQIANHVAASYRLDGGGQLVSVKPGPLALGDGTPLYLVVGAPSSTGEPTFTYVSGNSVVYEMCGLGAACAIKGKASTTRFMLVRREALELALYTFKYDGDVDSVVVLPPTKTDDTVALLFRREHMRTALSRPLAATLKGPAPTVKQLDKKAIQLVSALTSRNLFTARVEPAPAGGAFLVLEPMS